MAIRPTLRVVLKHKVRKRILGAEDHVAVCPGQRQHALDLVIEIEFGCGLGASASVGEVGCSAAVRVFVDLYGLFFISVRVSGLT